MGRSGDRLGIGHRPFLHAAVERGLAHMHVLSRQTDPLREILHDQQCQEHTDQQGPAEGRSALSIETILRVAGRQERPIRCAIIEATDNKAASRNA